MNISDHLKAYIQGDPKKKNRIRIIFLYFCRSNKKVYGFCFFGSPCITVIVIGNGQVT